ncbi:endonuclease/exonuclease/phosphatase family protein [Nocardioides sp.]|uniref:endonuclease/exonuclease/phosphatase family protein n=1 Tax=Nocardioides sp. TaxID=35761 RepID=UPI0027346309|nr:endonuclease/exonuclease/phosphatase family protein [Nocardioides sp.]MDP3891597.1 endonuclease/exonuclease/phosphatase family protein [Nocardioides sp.]
MPQDSGEGAGPEPIGPSPMTPAARAVTAVVAVTLAAVVGTLLLLGERTPVDAPLPTAESLRSSASAAIPAPPGTLQPTETATATDDLPQPPNVPASLCPQVPLTQPLTALAFNIHGGLGGGGRNLDRIAAEISGWQADVVLLQEVDNGRPRTGRVRQADVLGQAAGMSSAYGGNQGKPGGGSIGNAILSRHPILSSRNISLPRAGGGENRGLLHAVLDVNGLEVSVYSTHWDHRSGRARQAQARATAAAVAADPRPTLVGGDLNTVAGSGPLRTLRQAGLSDAWAVGEGPGLTVPAGSPRRRIDFLLHDEWFAPLQAQVLFSTISDHRAVWSRLELREELECITVGDQ